MIAVVVTAVLLLLSSWSSGEVYGAMEPNENTRLSGIVGNANLFGLLMLWGVMGLMFFWNVLKNTMARFFLMAGILPFIIAIIYSGSRKVFIVLNIFFVLWLLFTPTPFCSAAIGRVPLISNYSVLVVLSDRLRVPQHIHGTSVSTRDGQPGH